MWGMGEPGMWSELDLLLLKALQIYEDGICGGCGQPLAHTSDINNVWAFDLARLSCQACEFLDNSRKNDPPGAGVKTYVKNLMSQMWRWTRD